MASVAVCGKAHRQWSGNVDPDIVAKLGNILATGYGLAAFFAITGYGGMVVLFKMLVREQRDHLSDVRTAKAEVRESTPVLREIGDTLKTVRETAKLPEESHILQEIKRLVEGLERRR
jgi:hypothetical protein